MVLMAGCGDTSSCAVERVGWMTARLFMVGARQRVAGARG